MSKRMILIEFLFLLCSICFSEEIKSIKVEFYPGDCNKKTITIYDSYENPSSYPFRIFQDALTGWGRKNGCKKLNPLFVSKENQKEGTYIVYVMKGDSLSPQKFKVMNFKVMQNLQTKEYYETDFLQYLYEYMAGKYLQNLF